GFSPGTLNVAGNYNQSAGSTLAIELAGAGGVPGTDFDQLAVTGDVTLDGTLEVSTFGGFTPLPGMSFDIISFGGTLSGTFSSIVNSTGLAGLLFAVNSVTLELDGLGGDPNLDGVVGFGDFAILQTNFGQPGNFADGDFNGDGFVTFADFAILQNNFGVTVAPANVPEPATLTLLSLLSLAVLRRRR
ncbi:MAG: dockerin type I domain-containing protein, partial [Phycisphaeraceae bacterium]